MKKLVCSFLFLMLLPLHAHAQETDFREVAWGMSKAQVMQSEKAALQEDNGHIILYDVGRVKSMPAKVMYIFTKDDQLAMAAYNYYPQSFDGEKLIRRYNDMKKTISKEFGEPVVDEVKWLNQEERESFKGNTELGLLADECFLQAEWDDERSYVLLSLKQGEQSLLITEHYKSQAHIETLMREMQLQ